jgi:hypothetical protein
MDAFRKSVWILQFVALFAVPVLNFSLTGGYEAIVALLIEAVAFVGLLVGPVFSLASRTLRTLKSVPSTYAVLTVVLWAVSFMFPLSLSQSTDASTTPSVLTRLGLPDWANPGASVSAIIICVGLWLASVIAIVIGSTGMSVGPATSASVTIPPDAASVRETSVTE